MRRVSVYTDGACSGNPGPGGWGAVLLYQKFRKELSGYEAATTNNRMEITAAIRALEALKEPCEVDLYSDSSYLVQAFTKGWIANWQRNNWVKTDKSPVLNQDLWAELLAVSAAHKLHWKLVKGHADTEENNRCDALATGEIKRQRELARLNDG